MLIYKEQAVLEVEKRSKNKTKQNEKNTKKKKNEIVIIKEKNPKKHNWERQSHTAGNIKAQSNVINLK